MEPRLINVSIPASPLKFNSPIIPTPDKRTSRSPPNSSELNADPLFTKISLSAPPLNVRSAMLPRLMNRSAPLSPPKFNVPMIPSPESRMSASPLKSSVVVAIPLLTKMSLSAPPLNVKSAIMPVLSNMSAPASPPKFSDAKIEPSFCKMSASAPPLKVRPTTSPKLISVSAPASPPKFSPAMPNVAAEIVRVSLSAPPKNVALDVPDFAINRSFPAPPETVELLAAVNVSPNWLPTKLEKMPWALTICSVEPLVETVCGVSEPKLILLKSNVIPVLSEKLASEKSSLLFPLVSMTVKVLFGLSK